MKNRPTSPIRLTPCEDAPCVERLDALVVTAEPLWPMDHDTALVAGKVARALERHGLRVAATSLRPSANDAQAWLSALLVRWPEADGAAVRRFFEAWGGLGKDMRFAALARLGIKPTELAGMVPLVEAYQPRLVIAVGAAGPAMLACVKAASPITPTLWLGPEHEGLRALSQMLDASPRHWLSLAGEGLSFALNAVPFAGRANCVAAPNRLGAWALAGTGAARRSMVTPRGINLRRYCPAAEPIRPRTAVTWAPSLADPAVAQSLCRFAKNVWPRLIDCFPDARWRIIGPDAPASLRALEAIEGIKLVGPLADVRTYARRCRLALWPGRSLVGNGKVMLEGMALGVPTIASRLAGAQIGMGLRRGRNATQDAPALTCLGRRQWFEAIALLWTEPDVAKRLGENARVWAVAHANWQTNTVGLASWLEELAQGGDTHQPQGADDLPISLPEDQSRDTFSPIATTSESHQAVESPRRRAA